MDPMTAPTATRHACAQTHMRNSCAIVMKAASGVTNRYQTVTVISLT